MKKRLKRFTTLFLTVALCVLCVPAGAFAEAASDAQHETPRVLLYRLHMSGNEQWEGDEGWQTFKPVAEGEQEQPGTETQEATESATPAEANDEAEPADDANPEATTDAEQTDEEAVDSQADETVASEETLPSVLDRIEIKLDGHEATGEDEAAFAVRYRACLSGEELSDAWAADGAPLFSEQGFGKLEVQLSEDLDAEFDVWYRAKVAADEAREEVWLDWTKGADALASPDERSFVDFEVVLVAQGEPAPGDKAASTEQAAAEEETVEKTEGQEQPVATQATDDADASDMSLQSASDATIEAEAAGPSVEYRTHVQDYGWQGWVSDGTLAGTTGKSKRLEGINIGLVNASGGITYQTHVQDYGWQDWVSNGALAGTTGKSKRLEGIRINLTGEIANTYDVWYRTHVQDYGWQGWVSNGALAGTTGKSKRLEGIEILLVKKGGTIPPNATTGKGYRDLSDSQAFGVHYQTHVQNIGWQQEAADGQTAGTSGQSKRLEAIRIRLTGANGGIEYRTHVQDYGWQGWTSDGALSGTTGKSKRLEGINIRLTGSIANTYDVWYRTHVQTYGWQDWVRNGELAGTTGQSKRLEAIEIILLKKGALPPTYKQTLNGVDISGWQAGIDINTLDADFVIIKATEGVQGTLLNPALYNPSYKTWANQALAKGKLIGFYHYANGGDPIAEADWFYYAIQDYKGRAIACLDWEGQGNKTFDTGKDVAWCKKFLDRLKSRFGGTPFLYTSKNYTRVYNWTSVAQSYPLWGAEYPDYNPIYGYQSSPWQSNKSWGAWGEKPTIFQYTSTGILSRNGGIKEFDFDLFYGPASKWRSYQS